MRICVFCGSSTGADAAYADAARTLARRLAAEGIGMVYGGGNVGLMGVLADAALEAGGEIIGVMPRALQAREIAHAGLTELYVVESMHERKARMAELAEGFIALPGGAGTLEELFEQWTWAQLGIHSKPCGFLNVGGYYDDLRAQVERMVREGFLRPEHGAMLAFERDAQALLAWLRRYAPPPAKWGSDPRN